MRLLILFFSFNLLAADTLNVVVSGDSLSAGVFAGSVGIKSKDVDYKEREGSLFRKVLLFLVENHGQSWATGYSDYSIISRFERLGFVVNAFNSSVSGSTVQDVVSSQVPSISSWIERKKIEKLDMHIMFIGANNVCQSEFTDIDSFRRNYEFMANSFQAGVKVFVPLPDINHFYNFRNEKSKLMVKCKSIWKVTNSCPTIMAGDDVRSIIKAYNNVIKDIANNVGGIYVDSFDMAIFDKSDVSGVDCFHASKKGQKLIADHVWEAINGGK